MALNVKKKSLKIEKRFRKHKVEMKEISKEHAIATQHSHITAVIIKTTEKIVNRIQNTNERCL